MNTTRFATLFVSAAALSLGACDSGDDVEEVDAVVVNEPLSEAFDDDAYPVAGPLNEQQQAGYEAMDAQAISDEYDANRDTMLEDEAMSSDDSSSDGAMSDDESSQSSFTMPARSEMDFTWLDRNADGMISVAEYAIWALPTDPTEPEPNDAKPPYLTQDEINSAAQTFFYFDDDGDSYLSQSEFTAARNSALAS
ncbi:hypothetical protein [Aurantiacibacter flavus]|uniref:EF-hand domain-containing protein n=1 Tax=Aurantiacibacter flavus TaxID=3145232 RepID=A0ABV0CTC0_9SPHN